MARGAASKARPKVCWGAAAVSGRVSMAGVCSLLQSEYNEGFCPELFASLQLCYQAGVFVSRSSLGLMKIRRVVVLSILQFVNMVIWVLLPLVSQLTTPTLIISDTPHSLQWYFLPTYVLPSFMVYVGLLGGESLSSTPITSPLTFPPPVGASYVNIFYQLRTEAKFARDRQLCINLTQISIPLGILSGTLLELITIQFEK